MRPRSHAAGRKEARSMVWFVILLSAVGGGFIQAVTGFGAAVVMMLVAPHFFSMLQAPALTSAIALGLSAGLSWQLRKEVDVKKTLPLAAVYAVVSTTTIALAKTLDLELLAVVFGVFLIGLSIYYLLLSDAVSLRPGPWTGMVFALAAGVCGGLFSIGGPLLSIYFLAMFPSKRSYLANLQTLFVFTNLINTATRIYCGIYTWALVPLTLVGIVGVNVGKGIGLRILDRIDIRWMKRMVYIFIGISGVLTLIDHI